MLPDKVQFVFLSATIPNSQEFGEWIEHVHPVARWGAAARLAVAKENHVDGAGERQAVALRAGNDGVRAGGGDDLVLGDSASIFEVYLADRPGAVSVVGMIHGVLFVLYCLALLPARKQAAWPLSRVGALVLAALVPFGPFLTDRRLGEEQRALREERAER